MKTIYGNLITLAEQGRFDVIVHGCNCQNTMGKGIAKEIATRYPAAYAIDKATKHGDPNKLGTYTKYLTDKGFTIINAYTQYDYRTATHAVGPVLVDYTAVERVFARIARDYGKYRIGIPLIGAGLAGGDWDIISRIIKHHMGDADITLVRLPEHGYEEPKFATVG